MAQYLVDMITALRSRLNDNMNIPVIVRGENIPSVPCVVVETPDVEGETFIGGGGKDRFTQRIRIHDTKEASGFYALRPMTLAEDAIQVLTTSKLDVDTKEVFIPRPDIEPVSYSTADNHNAFDVVMRLNIHI